MIVRAAAREFLTTLANSDAQFDPDAWFAPKLFPLRSSVSPAPLVRGWLDLRR